MYSNRKRLIRKEKISSLLLRKEKHFFLLLTLFSKDESCEEIHGKLSRFRLPPYSYHGDIKRTILLPRPAFCAPDGRNTVYLYVAFGSDGTVSSSLSSSLGSSNSKVKRKKATTTSTTAAGATGFRPELGFHRLATR